MVKKHIKKARKGTRSTHRKKKTLKVPASKSSFLDVMKKNSIYLIYFAVLVIFIISIISNPAKSSDDGGSCGGDCGGCTDCSEDEDDDGDDSARKSGPEDTTTTYDQAEPTAIPPICNEINYIETVKDNDFTTFTFAITRCDDEAQTLDIYIEKLDSTKEYIYQGVSADKGRSFSGSQQKDKDDQFHKICVLLGSATPCCSSNGVKYC